MSEVLFHHYDTEMSLHVYHFKKVIIQLGCHNKFDQLLE